LDIGLFGGTFDPIHCGHLAVAEGVQSALNLHRIIFIPTGQPWLKEDMAISAAEHRVQMVRLAIAGKSGFELSTIEVERPGPSYTVDTLGVLRRQLGTEANLFFLLGSDALADFPKWKEPGRIIEMCQLVAFGRPGVALPVLSRFEKTVPGISQRVIFAETPDVDVSATEIRTRIAQGLSVDGMVPPAVEQYIEENHLYRER
jgi:nicotinate-nucleotide adenylyltransferase